MVAFSSLSDLMEQVAGTWLSAFVMRCMGAKVGKDVCFFGHGFEYDLLHIGDQVCIGPECDTTAHTVENMVMKMEAVSFQRGCNCMAGSVVMPGGVMEQGSTLIEHSQVLKGETVPESSYFGGLPAKLLHGYNLNDEFTGAAHGSNVRDASLFDSMDHLPLLLPQTTSSAGTATLRNSQRQIELVQAYQGGNDSDGGLFTEILTDNERSPNTTCRPL